MRPSLSILAIVGVLISQSTGCNLLQNDSNLEEIQSLNLWMLPLLTQNAPCADLYQLFNLSEEEFKQVRSVSLTPGFKDRYRVFDSSQKIVYNYSLSTGEYKIWIYGLSELNPSLQVCNSKLQPRGKTKTNPETTIRYLSAKVPAAPPLPPQEFDEEGNPIPRPPENLEGSRIGETTDMIVSYLAYFKIQSGSGFYNLSLHTPQSIIDNPFVGGGRCLVEDNCIQYDSTFAGARRHCEFLLKGSFSLIGNCNSSTQPQCSGAINNGLLTIRGSRNFCNSIFGKEDVYFYYE